MRRMAFVQELTTIIRDILFYLTCFDQFLRTPVKFTHVFDSH